MPLQPLLSPRLAGRIARLDLPDHLLVDIHHRLRDELLPSANPLDLMRRVAYPFDGLSYDFSLVDPHNRFREHLFFFHVFYGQNEECLIVSDVYYVRTHF